MAVERELRVARAKGLEVSAASATVCYVLADQIDAIERTGEDRYLLPQLVNRLLEERRAAATIPERPEGGADDIWASFSADLATLGDTATPG